LLLLLENATLRNPALFEYFEPHLHFVRDGEAIQALKRLESLLTLPLGLGLPMNDGCPFLDFAANRVEVKREKQGLEPALFRPRDRHREMGVQSIKNDPESIELCKYLRTIYPHIDLGGHQK